MRKPLFFLFIISLSCSKPSINIYEAAQKGNISEVKTFINSGIDILIKDNNDNSIFDIAISNKHIDLVKFLMTKGFDINSKSIIDTYTLGNPKFTRLHKSVQEIDLQKTQFLLKCGANVNITDYSENTPLHTILIPLSFSDKILSKSKINDTYEIIKVLIDNGANIDLANNKGNTPLFYAVNNEKMALYIINSGAEVNLERFFTQTPLHKAVLLKSHSIIKSLISKNVELNCRDEKSNTPLHNAVQIGDLDIVNILLSHGASINEFNDNYFTPLHIAVDQNNEEMITLLLFKGADIMKRNRIRLSVMDIAERNNNPKILKILKSHIENKMHVTSPN